VVKVDSSPHSEAISLEPLAPPRTMRPVVWWATAGVFFAVLQLMVYGAWIIQGDAYAQTTGPDKLDAGAKVLAWVLQGASTAGIITVLLYLFRRSRREGHLTWDSFIAIAFLSVFWQDTICNYMRPIFLYNSYMVNLGAWNPHIPGWISPHARNTPEPLLLSGPIYGWWFVLFAVVFCAMARRARKRWPQIGKFGIFAMGVVVLGFLDAALELTFIRGGLFAYSGVVRELSIWPGKTYQFPLYESLIVGVFCSTIGMLRLNRDDKGRSAIERGIDRVGVTGGKVTAVRAFAWIGLANTMFVILNIGYNWIGFYADTTPKYPSYLSNGLCGPGTGVDCPGQDIPIPMPRTPLKNN
jgi:hypothetical protein